MGITTAFMLEDDNLYFDPAKGMKSRFTPLILAPEVFKKIERPVYDGRSISPTRLKPHYG